MISAKDAIETARSLLGMPYGDATGQIDCINLIKYVIRKSPGGFPKYTTATTVSLWRSIDNAGRYKDVTWRKEGIDGAVAGMIAFKGKPRGDRQPSHVGLVTDVGTVIHASSAKGMVVETPLTANEGWTLLAQVKQIKIEGATKIANEFSGYYAMVNADNVNVRSGPGTQMKRLGQVNREDRVEILDTMGEWSKTDLGWIMSRYLTRKDGTTETDSEEPTENPVGLTTTLLNEDTGDAITLVGVWRLAVD